MSQESISPAKAEDPVDEYDVLHPANYPLLASMLVRQTQNGAEGCRLSVTLVMRGEQSANAHLVLKFEGVRELTFTQSEWSQTRLSCVEIRDIRSRGWEQIAYSVTEEEEGLISFICRSFRAQVCNDDSCTGSHED